MFRSNSLDITRIKQIMTLTNNIVARASVAFVTVAMAFALVAPVAQAESTSDMTLEQLIALVNQLQAQLAGTTTTGDANTCISVAQPLTVGAQGADVTELQNFLIGAGQSIPAGATGYFGSQTKAALASWQAAHNVAPAVGYYGPITKAAIDSACEEVTDGGTTGGSTGGSTSGLGNDEGSIDALDQVSADESRLEEGKTQGLFAFTAEIAGDVEVDRLDVYLDSTAAGAQSDNADDYFEGAELWVDGDKVADLDVSDFREETSYGASVDVVTGDTKAYRLRFSGLGLVFEDGDEPEFQVALVAVNNVDSTDLTETWGLDKPDMRFIDGQGFSDSITDATVQEDFSFTAEEKAEFRISESTDSPDATTVEVDDNDTSSEITIFVFDIDERNGVDAMIDEITMTASTTNVDVTTTIDEVLLYADGDLIGSDSPDAAGALLFENLGLNIDGDDSVEITAKVVFNGTDDYAEGNEAFLTFNAVTDASDDNGNDEGDITGANPTDFSSDTFTLRSEGISVSTGTFSTPTMVSDGVTTANNYGNYVMNVDVTAFGENYFVPMTTTRGASSTVGIAYQIEDSNGTVVSTGTSTGAAFARVSGGDTTGSYVKISDGGSATFKLTVPFDPATTGTYRVQILTVGYATTTANPTATETAVPAADFESDNLYVTS